MRRYSDVQEVAAGADAGSEESRDEVLLGRLMRSVGALPPSELRQRRVLSAVRERTRPVASGSRVPRMAFAAGGLLLIGGIAGAAIGHAAWNRAPVVPAVASPSAPSPSQAGPQHRSGGHGVAAASIAAAAPEAPIAATGEVPSIAPAATVEAAPTVSGPAIGSAQASRRPDARAHRAVENLRPSLPSTQVEVAPAALAYPQRVAPGDDEDAGKLLQVAARALRGSHDNARALILLQDYMSENPNGPLAEDALAMAIEAAAKLRDPDTAGLARRYLTIFPNGRYQEAARRAMLQFSDPAGR